MKIIMGSDHGGFELKEAIKDLLISEKIEFEDIGTAGFEAVDYPDYAAQVSERISSGEAEAGILVCGTGIGMSIVANKFPGVRAAVINDEYTAEMAKAHNNANVVCLGGRIHEAALGRRLISIWLKTQYEGGRHDRRLAKIAALDVQLDTQR